MQDPETLKNVQLLLRRYHQAGLEQIEIFKELHPGPVRRKRVNGRMMGEFDGVFMPIEDVTRRIGVQENVFLVEVLKGFWDYFLLNLEYIESPARQGIDRTLIELCYQRLIPYTTSTPAVRKRRILITNICDVGMVLAAPSEQDMDKVPQYTTDYNFWVTQLTHEDDRNKFQTLQEDGYPTHAYANAKHKLWPSFFTSFNDHTEALIFPWAGESAQEIEKARLSFLRLHKHQHDFVHGSHLSALIAMEDKETKKHLFGSFAISTQVGYQMLHTVNTNYLDNRALELNELFQQTGELIPLLLRNYSHLYSG